MECHHGCPHGTRAPVSNGIADKEATARLRWDGYSKLLEGERRALMRVVHCPPTGY